MLDKIEFEIVFAKLEKYLLLFEIMLLNWIILYDDVMIKSKDNTWRLVHTTRYTLHITQ